MLATASAPAVSSPFKVDVSRGSMSGRVSSEWFSRPDDERFLSLTDLHASVAQRSERSTTRIVESKAVRVEARSDNPERLALILPHTDEAVTPTNWSFSQMCSLVRAPSSYLKEL